MGKCSVGGTITASLLCAVVGGAWARPQPAIEEPAPSQSAEEPEISDDVIVDVLIQTQRLVERTAAVGISRPAGPVRDEARRVQASCGRMAQRLETYARRRGFASKAADRRAAMPQATARLGELLDGLRGLEPATFNHAFLAVLHDFLGQMTTIVRGAEQLVTDASLRTMLGEMERELDGQHGEVEVLQLRFPPPTGGPGPVEDGAATPADAPGTVQ